MSRVNISQPTFLCQVVQRQAHLVIVSSHYYHIAGYAPEVLESLFVAHVASAQDLLDFSRDKKLLEFRGKVVYSMRDVKVADDKD